MPRYIPINTVSFTDKNGNTYPVKERRPIEQTNTAYELNIVQGDEIDELISRISVFGDLAEYRSYQLVDANIVELKENKFDLDTLRKLRVPL